MRTLFTCFFVIPVLFLAAQAPAHADERILACTLNFGSVAQIDVYQGANGYSYRLLSNSGRMNAPVALEASSWERRDLSFRYDGDRYHVYAANGRDWQYEVTSEGDTQPGIVGTADCL